MRRIAIAAVVFCGILPALAGLASGQSDRPFEDPRVRVEFLDVGQGDAILIRSPEGKTALIDAGPHRELVANMLRGRGISSLDLVVLSHHHQDHYDGLESVIRRFRPRLFVDSGSSHTTPHYLRLIELVRDRGIPAIEPSASPRRISLGSVVLTVFPRAPENPMNENENSVGIRLQFKSFSVLLPGDAESGERTWWEKTVPQLCSGCTILKLAHHGSNNGTDARWLGLVRPGLAVASVGKGNEYGHPGSETLALLARDGIPLRRTDRDGTIVVESNGLMWWRRIGEPVVGGTPEPKPRPYPRPRRDAGTTRTARRININTATEAELETLPGVGPVLARRIIAGRPYRTIDDLRKDKGIGDKHIAELRALVTVE